MGYGIANPTICYKHLSGEDRETMNLGLVHSHSLWTMVTVFETASSILSREHVSNAWMCIRPQSPKVEKGWTHSTLSHYS
jgi:hypothetical protein